ncbi:MAG: rod shape-determining protein MreC [Pseudobdellovibrionaceae bacterium]|nr:rod shape-determining protein MreC [Bdellovibrionales bacterium]USN48753.1 MAG: rod shape-determining protein MreC [Pseudobdellovibrionaceae bacterium]
MGFFTTEIKKFVLTALVVSMSLIAVNMQQSVEDSPWYLRPFSVAAGLVQNAYSGFSSGVRGTAALYLNLVDIKKQNRELLKTNAKLTTELGDMTELRLENERLNDLLAFKKKTTMDLLAAKVIGRDLMPDHYSVTINRGTQHGVKKGMAAITVGGIVGYVIQPELLTAQILLLPDRYASVDAIVQRSRARGIVQGLSKDTCRMEYLQRGDDVVVGDLVVTSGLQNIFPKGYPVGTVTQVRKNRYGISQDVELQPAVNPFTIEELFIVLNTNNEDFTPPPPKQSLVPGRALPSGRRPAEGT